MKFTRKFHLVIGYKKGIYNKVAYMFSRPIFNAFVILKHNSIMHEIYIEQYAQDDDFKDVFATLTKGNHVEELDYHVHNKLLYHLDKLCVPQGERINVIREAHTSFIVDHFGVGEIIAQIHRHFYWPLMNESLSIYVK